MASATRRAHGRQRYMASPRDRMLSETAYAIYSNSKRPHAVCSAFKTTSAIKSIPACSALSITPSKSHLLPIAPPQQACAIHSNLRAGATHSIEDDSASVATPSDHTTSTASGCRPLSIALPRSSMLSTASPRQPHAI